MIERIDDLPGDVIGMRAIGTFSVADYVDTIEPEVERVEAAHSELRLLLHLGPQFDGFGDGAWGDLTKELRATPFHRGAVVTDDPTIRTGIALLRFALHGHVRSFGNDEYAAGSQLGRGVTIGRLHQVAMHVDDLDRAAAFYRDVLGLPLVARFDPPGLAFFDLGNVRLLLEGGAPASMLYLEVDDIDAVRARLVDEGVTFVDEPHLIFSDVDGTFGPAGTGEWMTFLRDSEGNLVGLVERRAG